MLELAGVEKRFGRVEALRGVSLAVARRQTAVLIGASGSGKSTVLRLIVGLTQPDSGSVRFDGEPVTARNLAPLRRRIGYVIQEGGLFPHLTAYDNAALMARHLRWPEDRVRARIDELRELARLPGDALSRYPAELSGGQRQRVGLMRALMLDPDALLLDEPLGALDPITRAELQDDLRAIFDGLHKTVLWVTHDLAEAAFFGDFVALMRDGRVLQQGSLADLIERPSDEYVTRFVSAQRGDLRKPAAGAT
jgi:osmoprotectant transport system ATP-binding protein